MEHEPSGTSQPTPVPQATPSQEILGKFCASCGAALPQGSGSTLPMIRFCPQCGCSVSGSPHRRCPIKIGLSLKQKLGIGLIAIAAFIPAAYFAQWKTGTIPTDTVASLGEGAPPELPPAVLALQQAAEKSPNDLKIQNAYAAEIVGLLRDQEEPPQALVLEAVQQLSKVLQLNPNEPDALLSLADISFNQQVFNKASELYGRYLTFRKDDLDVRARFGSTLMFMGEFKQSIEEQQKILKINPNHFQAAAYVAIAMGESGDIAGARKATARAMELAPNDDARKRLQAFVNALDRKEQASINNHPVKNQTTASQTSAQGAFEKALRANPVAGPKVMTVTIANGVATAQMDNFPMAAMPPFAKEKFFGSLAQSAKEEGITTIIFVDKQTRAESGRHQF